MADIDIMELHRALLDELRLPFFTPAMNDQRAWSDFLSVQKSLEETPDGPLAVDDIRRVIRWMREQNAKGAGWALRFSKIMREPETFRDLVLERRRKPRPIRPSTIETTRQAGDITRTVEVAATADPVPAGKIVQEAMADLRRKMCR